MAQRQSQVIIVHLGAMIATVCIAILWGRKAAISCLTNIDMSDIPESRSYLDNELWLCSLD